MRFAVVASALFAGLVAAAPAVTETVHSTEVETITSCGVSWICYINIHKIYTNFPLA